MKLVYNTCWLVLSIFFFGCSPDDSDQESMLIFSRDYDFAEGQHEWIAGFADYPAGTEDSAFYELRYAYAGQPVETQFTKKTMMLSGNNHNQDLFMYLKRKVTRLNPDTEYTITFNVELAADLPANQDSPGSIYLKAGATPVEPVSVEVSGNYRMNIDKGTHGDAGGDMISLGNLRTPESAPGYALFVRNNIMANTRYVVITNSRGELWLIIGTDSSIQGRTAVFYNRVNVVFSAS